MSIIADADRLRVFVSRQPVQLEPGFLLPRVQRSARLVRLTYAWRSSDSAGRGLQWWLGRLESPATRRALLEQHFRA